MYKTISDHLTYETAKEKIKKYFLVRVSHEKYIGILIENGVISANFLTLESSPSEDT